MSQLTAKAFQICNQRARSIGMKVRQAVYDGCRWRLVFALSNNNLVELVCFQLLGNKDACVFERCCINHSIAVRRIWRREDFDNHNNINVLDNFLLNGK
jgi:hypothetical protein